MYIIMLGAPGSGKGTTAKILAKKTNLPHISTGDMFREQIKKETELGKLANSYISQGRLVPDEVTINIVKDRLNWDDTKNGVILDGFPRTIEQAKALDEILKEKGKKIKLDGEGLLAQAIAHEIDHLDGILFVDKIIPGTLEYVTPDENKGGKTNA